jgi:DUF917 family protein
MKGKEAKKTVIPRTISECLEIGKFIRESRESGLKVLDYLARKVNGWFLFKGIVAAKETEDKDGYYWGVHTINGLDEFSGQTFKIWFKNENHISWLDNKPYVTSPDIIEVIDAKTGEPITNPDLKEGDEVAVIGVRKRKAFDNKKGIDVLGPSHYGFDIEHKPIEKVMSL